MAPALLVPSVHEKARPSREGAGELRAEHVLNRPFWSLPVGEIAQKLREARRRVLENGSPETLHDVPFQLPTGETRKLTLQVTPLTSKSGAIIGVVGVASALGLRS